jgi:hypothetical protein
MGDLSDKENPLAENLFNRQGIRKLKQHYLPPGHDETLYILK